MSQDRQRVVDNEIGQEGLQSSDEDIEPEENEYEKSRRERIEENNKRLRAVQAAANVL